MMMISKYIDEMMCDRANGMSYIDCLEKYHRKGMSFRQCQLALSLCGKRLSTPNVTKVLDEYGGVEFIRNLKARGFNQKQICDYFNFSVSSLQIYLRRLGVTFSSLEVPTYTLTEQIVEDCKVR